MPKQARVPLTQIGTKLHEAMTRRGLSQTQLAKMSGVSQATISRLLWTEKLVRKPMLLALAHHLGIPAQEFLSALPTGHPDYVPETRTNPESDASYPVQGTELRTCAVLMHDDDTDETARLSNMIFDHVVRKAIEAAGCKCDGPIRRSGDSTGRQRTGQVLQDISVLVADVTAPDTDTVFELGFRLAQGAPCVLISRNPERFRLRGRFLPVFDYTNPDAITQIASAIRAAFESVGPMRSHSLASIVREFHAWSRAINPFQDLVASWRLDSSLEEQRAILRREFKVMASVSIFSRLAELHRLLGPGLQYLTISNQSYWHLDDSRDAEFLQSNVNSVKEGLHIRRVFVLSETSWLKRETELVKMVKEHEGAQRKTRSCRGSMMIKYLLVGGSDEQLSEELRRWEHFALAREHGADPKSEMGIDAEKDRGCMVIKLEYPNDVPGKQGVQPEALRIRFSDGPTARDLTTRPFFNRFKRAFGQALPYSKLTPLWDEPAPEPAAPDRASKRRKR